LLSSLLFAAAATVLLASPAAAQGLTGALIGTVKDDQGGVLSGAEVRVSSPALIGADLPRTGVGVAASLQYFTGKPWAATAQIPLPQNNQQRILLEAPGSRRLSSQTLLDLRVSRRIDLGGVGFDCLSTCSTCSTTRRRRAWRPTICSASTSLSPPCSWIRVARWSE
jgi:hypothetical protein